MKKRYLILTIGILFILVLVLLMGIKKQRVSYEQQILPVLDTPGKSPLVSRIQTLTTRGGRVDWSPKGDLIAFDRLGEDGYYDVWLMKPNGTEQKCLTCNNPQLPKHNGQPAWHPLVEYIVFQVQDPSLKGMPRFFAKAELALTGPGAGVNNNLWLTNKEGSKFWQLTYIKDKMGVLHPHFSHDGKKLLWSELINTKPKPSGQWLIKVADFVIQDGQPRLENIKQYQPSNLLFYETHGFSPDDREIIFSGSKTGVYQELEIYLFNLQTKEVKTLTEPALYQWDEHAQLSPDGEKISWMSSQDIEQKIEQDSVITDYWIMEKDGSNKQRLTYFNNPSAPEYLPGGVVAADSSWSPDGNALVAYIFRRSDLRSMYKSSGSVVIIELE